MNRRTGTLALLAALCVLAAAVEARSPTLRDDADADDYCKACVDGQEPQYRLARCTDEVAQCESGHFCNCKSGKRAKCTWPWTRFNPENPNGNCERNFDCQAWLNSHPVNPTPAPSPPAPSSSTTLPPSPTTGSTTNAPGPATRSTASGSSTATAGSTTKGPAPGSSTIRPAPGSSTIRPAPGSSTSKPAPGSSTSKPAPVPGSSTSKPAPSGSSTVKPKPNGAPWGHRAGLGLLALGVAAALL